jgi:hypothetical protein
MHGARPFAPVDGADKCGKVQRIDEVALQEWRGNRIFRERFFYDPSRPKA